MISNHIYLNNKSIFLYIFILIICLFLARIIPITLSVIFFLAIGFCIIYLLYSYTYNNHQTENYSQEDIFTKHLDKYRIYQESRYQNLISKLDNFNEIYDDIRYNPSIYCYQNIDLAIGYARDAINILTSFNLLLVPTDPNYYFLQSDITNLKQIMNKYINQLVTFCNKYVPDHPYLNPKPYNEDDNVYDQFNFD